MEFIFQNFIRSFMMELPSEKEIYWKLMRRGDIEKVKKVVEGKQINEYEYKLIHTSLAVFDGEIINVQVKNGHDTNQFKYSNPDAYLEYYPEINELN